MWESEKAKYRKAFTSERYTRLNTRGGSYETTDNIQYPEVEELVRKPHIVEWTNNYDSDGAEFNNLDNIDHLGIINVEKQLLVSGTY